MKKAILFLILFASATSMCQSQEWMNSLDVAKRLARVQDKLIFAMWENATLDSIPVLIKSRSGKYSVGDLFADKEINRLVWDYFVPVKIQESNYEALFSDIKDKRSLEYIDKFNDNTIKIMDVNGNILNTSYLEYYYENLDFSFLVDNYALKTTFLKHELMSYAKNKTFLDTYLLASKYLDYSTYVNEVVRKEVVKLALIYLNEAVVLIENENPEKKPVFKQRCELLYLKQFLILNNPKKTLRQLKKYKKLKIEKNNESLYASLKYTAYKLLKKDDDAEAWKAKISSVDLKKINVILKINQ